MKISDQKHHRRQRAHGVSVQPVAEAGVSDRQRIAVRYVLSQSREEPRRQAQKNDADRQM